MSIRAEQNRSNQCPDPIRSHIPTLRVVEALSKSIDSQNNTQNTPNGRDTAVVPAFSPGGACAVIIPDAESSLRPRPSNRTFSTVKSSRSNKREIVPLIIPFRDRNQHLEVFLAHMESHLERHNLEPMFIIVEQVRITCLFVGLCGSLLQFSHIHNVFCSMKRIRSASTRFLIYRRYVLVH